MDCKINHGTFASKLIECCGSILFLLYGEGSISMHETFGTTNIMIQKLLLLHSKSLQSGIKINFVPVRYLVYMIDLII